MRDYSYMTICIIVLNNCVNQLEKLYLRKPKTSLTTKKNPKEK